MICVFCCSSWCLELQPKNNANTLIYSTKYLQHFLWKLLSSFHDFMSHWSQISRYSCVCTSVWHDVIHSLNHSFTIPGWTTSGFPRRMWRELSEWRSRRCRRPPRWSSTSSSATRTASPSPPLLRRRPPPRPPRPPGNFPRGTAPPRGCSTTSSRSNARASTWRASAARPRRPRRPRPAPRSAPSRAAPRSASSAAATGGTPSGPADGNSSGDADADADTDRNVAST